MASRDKKTDIYTRFRQQYNARTPAARERAKAIAESIATDAGQLSQEEIDDIAFQLAYTGDFNFSRDEPTEDVSTTEPEAEPAPESVGFGSSLEALLGAGRYANIMRRLTGASSTQADAYVELNREVPYTAYSPYGGVTQSMLRATESDELREEREANARERLAKSTATINELQPQAKGLEAALNERALGDWSSRIPRAAGQVAGQPEQLLPLIGGVAGTAVAGPAGGVAGAIAGATPMAESAYNQSWMEAKEQFGANDEEADAYAGAMVAVEFGTEALGGATAGAASKAANILGVNRLGKQALQNGLSRVVASRTSRIATAAAGEGTTEVMAELGGDALRQSMESNETLSTPESRERLKSFNAEQAASRLDRVLDAFTAGAIGGAAIGAPAAQLSYAAELGQREQRVTGAVLGRKQPSSTSTNEVTESNTPVTQPSRQSSSEAQMELFPEAVPGPSSEVPAPREPAIPPTDRAIDDPLVSEQRRETLRGLRQREVDRIADLEQREADAPLLRESGYDAFTEQDATDLQRSRERVQALDREIGRWEGGAARQPTLPLNTPKQPKPKAPKPVQTRGGDTVYNPDGTTSSNVDTANRKAAQKMLDQESRTDNSLINAEFKRLQDKRATDRRKHLETVANETRGLPVEQRLDALTSATREWDAANPVPVRESIDLESLRNRKTASVKATPKQESTTVPKVQQEQQGSNDEQRIKNLADKLGLGMADGDNTSQSRSFDRAKYEGDVRKIVRALSRKNTQQSVDVLNLAEQGKLELVPNPESVGQPSSNNVALYRPSEGKMYMYTDRIDPKDATAAIIRGYHEGTHGGQFNERQGRDAVLRTLLGDDKFGNVVDIIKRAANSGNAVAKRAVDKATANAPQDTDLEIPAYFVGEVVANRDGVLGSVGGVARDIRSAAKRAVKAVVGGDPDVSFNDIYSAVNNLGQEIVQTDLQPTEGVDTPMVMNDRATGFAQAQQDARDFVDEFGNVKFLLSDEDSSINELGLFELLSLEDGETMNLGNLLNHPEFYRNYPDAEMIQVGINPKLKSDGVYIPTLTEIQVARRVANGRAASDLRGIILHELQHWVQDEGGESSLFHGMAMDAKNLSEAEMQDVDAYNTALEKNNAQVERVMNNVHVFSRELPGRTQQAGIAKILAADDTRVRKATQLVQAAEDSGSLSPHLRRIVDDYIDSLDAYRAAAMKYNAVSRKAYDRYLANPTEAEAFFTQAYRDTPQSQLPRNPREDSRYGTKAMQAQAMNNRSRDLAMADGDLPVTRRHVPAWVRGLFDSSRGVGQTANEIIEHAMESPAGDRMRAEASMGKFDSAISKLAMERGVTERELNSRLEKELDAIPNDLDGYDANRAAFDAVVNKYGPAGEALKSLRDQIDDLSLTMIQQRADSGIPLNEQEKKTYQTILNNLGRYTHRQYAAHAGQLGNQYSKTVYKDYEKYKAGKGKEDPGVKENYSRVADAVKYLVDKNLSIPADDRLGNLGADQTRALYTTWVGNTNGVSLEDMKLALMERRDQINGDTDALTKEAENITRELLDLAPVNSPITSYYRGGKLNTGIIQKRQRIADPLRNLMGEVTDPSMRMLMTVAKQSEFVARNKMFLELAANPAGDLLPPGSRRPENWTRLAGEGYGPLQGYIASPNMIAAIGDVTQVLATFEQAAAMASGNPRALGQHVISAISDKWSWLAGTSKLLQIVWSPMNFLYNLGGGGFVMLQNGNVNPATLKRSVGSAVDLVAYAVNPKSASKEAIRLVENGVVDSAFIGEVKNEQYRQLRDLIRQMSNRERSPTMKSFMDVLHTAKSGVKETYAMMDVMYKIANFYQQVDLLNDFYKKNGDTRTAEQIDREAADITKRTNFTYRRAMPLVKAIEQRGFSAFGPYMNEVFRTQITNVLQGLGELERAKTANTPEASNVMRVQAAKRLSGQMAIWGMLGYVSSLLGHMTFGEDDEEAEAKRALLPEYLRDQDFIQVGTDSNGYPVLFNVARFDPIGPATDIMRDILHNGASVDSVSDKMIDLYVTPRIGSQAVIAVKATIDPKSKVTRVPLAQELAPEAYSEMLDVGRAVGIPARVSKAWTNVAETMLPGITSSWRSTNARPGTDDPVESAFTALSYVGTNMVSLDPKKPIRFAAMDYKDSVTIGRQELAEFFKDNPNRSEQAALSQVLNARSKEKEAFDDARKVYEGASAVGWTKGQIHGALKQQRLTADQIKALSSGDFRSTLIAKESLDRYRDMELADAPKSEHRAIKKKWQDIWGTLRKVQSEVKKEDRN